MAFDNFTMVDGDDDAFFSQDHLAPHYTRPSPVPLIDPSLEAGTPSTGLGRGQYGVERYLSEPHNHLFQPLRPQEGQYSANESNITSPPPCRLQGRHNSPFSQHHSSATSGIPSPYTESDLYYESTRGPATPQDQAVASPAMSGMSLDQWDHSPSNFYLAGASFTSTGGCVNPSVINSGHSAFVGSHDSKPSMEFTLCRDPSFDSTNSSQYQETAPYHPTSLHPESAQPFTKTEMQLDPAQVPCYPDPESIDEDTKSPGNTTAQPESRDDEDEDSKPTTRREPARNASISHRRTRSKLSSSSTPSNRVSKNSASPGAAAGCRIPSPFSDGPRSCAICPVTFKDDAALQKHTKTQHTRPFTCVFDWAGCPSTFATKNEWKRHVTAQHLALFYYLCTQDSCGQPGSRQSQSRSAVNGLRGRPFRRKDLFTQHARRMHVPAFARKSSKAGGDTREWEEELKLMQENACRQRCHLPTHMRCPATGCSLEFYGEKAWDERMEHVARHLERAADGKEPKVQFGGPHDDTLVNWATSKDVGVVRLTSKGWKLGSPLKDLKMGQNVMSPVDDQGSMDEDAEGEEYFH